MNKVPILTSCIIWGVTSVRLRDQEHGCPQPSGSRTHTTWGACVGWRSVCLGVLRVGSTCEAAASPLAQTRDSDGLSRYKAWTWVPPTGWKGCLQLRVMQTCLTNCQGCYFLQPQKHLLLAKFCNSYFIVTIVIENIKGEIDIIILVEIKDGKCYLSKGKYPYWFQLIYHHQLTLHFFESQKNHKIQIILKR